MLAGWAQVEGISEQPAIERCGLLSVNQATCHHTSPVTPSCPIHTTMRLFQPVPCTEFKILNLTSQTVFIVFLGLLYDFGATAIPCFVDYFTVEPSRAKSHFTQSSLKDVCKYFSLIFNRFVTKLLLLTKATLLQW